MGLIFGDAQLEQEDVKLLDGPFWLNDSVIAFAMEYFSLRQFQDVKDVMFISPSIVQLVALITDPIDLATILEGSKLSSDKVICLPLNDHDNPNTRGGTHWSLLVYSDDEFFLLDSLQSSGLLRKAELVGQRLHAAFGLGTPRGNSSRQMVSPVQCPQQRNGYDCGVATVAFAYGIASAVRRHGTRVNLETMVLAARDACHINDGNDFSHWRQYLLRIVHEVERL